MSTQNTKTLGMLTVEKLAEVALDRRIHTWFEQAWARTMNGVNPVLCAVKAVNAKKEKEARDFKLKVISAIGVTCFFAMLTIAVLYPYFGKLWENLSVAKLAATSILIVVVMAFLLAEFVFTAIAFWDEFDKKIPGEGNTAMANAFCGDLQVFINGIEMDIDSWFNWSLCADMEAHKFRAFTILVRVAKQILLVQAQIPAEEQARKYDAMENAGVILKGKLMEELEGKYNALQRLGVISGGYEKIFKKAAEPTMSTASTQG